MMRVTVNVSDVLWGQLTNAAALERRSVSSWVVLAVEAALREPGIPLSGGGAREAGRPNTAFQASTSGSRSADEHFKPYPKPGGKS